MSWEENFQQENNYWNFLVYLWLLSLLISIFKNSYTQGTFKKQDLRQVGTLRKSSGPSLAFSSWLPRKWHIYKKKVVSPFQLCKNTSNQNITLEGHKRKWTRWLPPGRDTGLMKSRDGKETFHSPTLMHILNSKSYEHTAYSKHTDIHTDINKSHSTIFMINVDRYHCSYNLKQ